MRITLDAYKQLIQCPKVPPEIGGILGGRNSTIETIIFDEGKKPDLGIKYIPNVTFLNQHIQEWSTKSINFYGLFHTHSQCWRTLSNNDKRYIETIMRVMPKNVTHLYFPLVFPEYDIKAFRVEKRHLNVYISEEKIIIIC